MRYISKIVDWYWTTGLKHVVPNLPELGKLVLREQRQRDQDAVCRNRYGAAPVQIVVVRHSHLADVPVVVDDAQSMNATLVDMVTAVGCRAGSVC